MAKETAAQRLKRAYREVFCLPHSDTQSTAQRLVLGDLMKHTGALQAIACVDSEGRVDASATLVAVGKQSIGLHIVQILNLPDRHLMAVADEAIRVEVQHHG